MEERYDNRYVFFVKLYIISSIDCYPSGNRMYSLIPIMFDAITVENDNDGYKYKSVITDRKYKTIEENDLEGSISVDADSMISLSYYDSEKTLTREEIYTKLIEFRKNHSFSEECNAYENLINLYDELLIERSAAVIKKIIDSIGEREAAKMFVGSSQIDYKLCEKDEILIRERR